jgi:hypothetical protein
MGTGVYHCVQGNTETNGSDIKIILIYKAIPLQACTGP